MFKKSMIMIIIIIILFFVVNGYSVEKDYGSIKVHRIVSVYDGDTFYADILGCPDVFCKRIGIRIYGIDTPEMRSKNEEEKAKALVAKAMLESLLRMGEVQITKVQRDKYFRILGKVIVITDKEVIDIEGVMIQKGLARPYFGGTKEEW